MEVREIPTVSRGRPAMATLEALIRRRPECLTDFEAIQLEQKMGALACWLLEPEVLKLARRRWNRPCPNIDLYRVNGPGFCLILCVQVGHGFPALRRSFGVPLRWWPRTALPRGIEPVQGTLAELAADVQQTLARERPKLQGYVLCPAEPVPREAMALLEDDQVCTLESGWLPVALGLLTAHYRYPLASGLVATGAWRADTGLMHVGEIPEKVRLAVDLGARWMLVPSANKDEAEEARNKLGVDEQSLTVVPLVHDEPNFFRVVRDVVHPIFSEPAPNATPEQLKEYFFLLHALGEAARAREFAQTRIHPLVIQRLRQEWERETGNQEIDYLLTIASGSPETACYAIGACCPRCVFVFYTEDNKPNLRRLLDMLDSAPTHQRPAHITPVECKDIDDLIRKAELYRANLPADATVALDLTPGTKEMTLAFALDISRPRDFNLYIRHRIEDRLPVPFSQDLCVWGRPKRPV